ncbi:WD40/YVTN/BNR-like repeat-containing protein [Alicyclobacillus acidoterrestris]|uniref:Sortilin N-terminal domain-containing protein n=1 Tax=Alicyclobacillus acidoterrestris (strain ATCC 49025 / DSM 3922 / CIP 106132 / NCIMB 13137 / GD3B) TaxID=1356854 RepID=A0A9E7CT00_ALIAG|nr:hypothetical protein [Alicyclobacillus acidoterrestris]UNO50470.1 hypothetical protein K1I37_08405 [Alicyclobacillus acidoterrestris]
MPSKTMMIITIVTATVLLAGCGASNSSVVVPNFPAAQPKTTTNSVATPTGNTSTSNSTSTLQINANSLFMTSKSTGWNFPAFQGDPILNDAVLHTHDSGKTWHNSTPAGVASQYTFAGGLAVSDSEAWFVASTGQKTMLYHTTNGGASWTSISVPKSYIIGELSFTDSQHGWLLASQGPAVGQEPIDLYSTSDGGKTWSRILSKTVSNKLLLGNKTGITFVNSTTGWLTVDSGQHPGQVGLYVTNDDGRTWGLQNVPVPTNLQKNYAHPLAPTFSSSQMGFMPVIFNNGSTVIYTTQNGGQTWSPTTPIPISQVVRVSLTGGTIYVTDGQTVYYSHDNGLNWEKWKGKVKSGGQIGAVTPNGAYVVGNGGSRVTNIPICTSDFAK